ncbi:Fusaric acid resistance protein-like-domain-containing protein [Auriculariales sp. MPI-PUGE-AT-0066]|nr:Fusaric acid resistance protein-like-domain-containing protein [Auriculariales sp. MPI-PUGE-AT-0066]
MSARSVLSAARQNLNNLSATPNSTNEEHWTIFEQLMHTDLRHRPSRDSFHSAPRSIRTQPSAISIGSEADSVLTAEPGEMPFSPPPQPKHIDPTPAPPPPKTTWGFPRLTSLQRNVLKCAIAYLIGSLFTFMPVLSKWISPNQGPSIQAHLIATVTVYYNPAKTVGSLMEADVFCVAGLAFATFIALGSMSTFWPFELSPGWEPVADVIVLTWIATAFIFVAWAKNWLAKPSFNTACSMIAIIIFIVVVKEGGLATLLIVAEAATDADPTVLGKAIEAHQSSFTTLKRNLAEAKTEWLLDARMRDANITHAYDDAVDSMTRLGQHLNGLRSGIAQQTEFTGKGIDGASTPANEARAVMFAELVDDLGPPLTSLTTASREALRYMEGAFRKRSTDVAEVSSMAEFERVTHLLDRALFAFDSTSNHAIMRVYRRSALASEESVFLVYWFIFTLQEFAKELVTLGAFMQRIKSREDGVSRQSGWKSLRWMRRTDDFVASGPRPTLRRRVCASSLIYGKAQSSAFRLASFPRFSPHAPNTAQTPAVSTLSLWGGIKLRLWWFGQLLRESEMKYAVKTGLALAILAAPAFYDPTRPFFLQYKGEWALISFFVVMSPTIGATNFLSLHRVLGTWLGAATAAAVYLLFSNQPAVLAIFGFLFSIPCFYVIVSMPQYATSGRFVLLTYNLTCLYCYNARESGANVQTVAIQRSLAVMVGVLWAAFVSRFWWPTEARRELTKKLSQFSLEMGWLYTRLVASYSASEDAIASAGRRPRLNGNESLLPLTRDGRVDLDHSVGEFMAMELYLQIQLIQLQDLLKQAQREPRLKGPFPVGLYRSILTSMQKILDKIHSMRCVTLREEWCTVRRDFIVPVNKERKEMVGNIILYFSTLSSAFRTKAPLPPYLPAAERSRQILVAKMRELPVIRNREVKGSRQLLYFAYALTMQGVTHELDELGARLQDAFGVIGHTRQEFENLFNP